VHVVDSFLGVYFLISQARLGDRINTFFTKELKKDSIDNIKEKKMHGRYEILLF